MCVHPVHDDGASPPIGAAPFLSTLPTLGKRSEKGKRRAGDLGTHHVDGMGLLAGSQINAGAVIPG